MTVRVTKDKINVREKLTELDKPSGIAGLRMLAADTPQEQFELIGAGRRNLLINGNFQVSQRATTYSSGTDNGYLTADRWHVNNSGGTSTHSLPDFTVGQTDVPGFPQRYYRFESTVGNNNQGIHQRVEDVRVLGGRTVTLSFWAKGTNPTAGYFVSSWIQDFGTGGSTGVETLMDDRIVLTSSWKKYTITAIVPSISGKTIGTSSYTWVEVLRQAASDTGTGAWTADIANVQLEFGSVATPFEHRSYGEELALCQRYFQFASGMFGTAASSTQVNSSVLLPTPMRAAPTLSKDGGNIQFGDMVSYGAGSSNSPVLTDYLYKETSVAFHILGFTGLTQYRTYRHEPNGSSTGRIALDAEL